MRKPWVKPAGLPSNQVPSTIKPTRPVNVKIDPALTSVPGYVPTDTKKSK